MSGALAALIDRGEDRGCLELSEVDELAQALELEDAELSGAVRAARRARDRAARRLRRAKPRRVAPVDDAALAHVTTDTLQLFLNEIGRHRLLTPDEEIDLAQADRARRPRGEGAHDQREPAPRRLDREEVPGLRADAARPDPGGHPRPDPRGREVRLAPRLPLLHVRDVVDPPGRRARDGRQGAHDQAADQPRPHAAQGRARRERAVAQARSRADRRRGRRRGARSRSRICTRCATRRAPSRRSTARSARGRRRVRRPAPVRRARRRRTRSTSRCARRRCAAR